MEHTLKRIHVQAYLCSAAMPPQEQMQRLEQFLREKYREETSLVWKETPELTSGFRIEVGTAVYHWNLEELYDWSFEAHKKQLEETLLQAARKEGAVLPLLKNALEEWKPRQEFEEIGVVLSVGDEIAEVSGRSGTLFGDILELEAGSGGWALELKSDRIGCVLFGDDREIAVGSIVKRTGRAAGIPVGEAFLGRIVDALGSPIDGKGEIRAEGFMPVETPAPGIIDRQPVNTPMETGLLAIDAMFPIGRGQRELIIGDRQTGKTAIALDTILNQKGKNVVCIYVAIGQKASSVAGLVETLREHGAMEYCVVLSASASDPDPLQYIAPYAGCAMGEYFMNKGRDVLIVYDDLSKHAIAYRAISLLLERSPGREAYPGDVFYLHSRLLERSAHLSEARGGGSMTALPIVETQEGDVSAYIPTNIISITDGQIFLESDLFFAGQRPAVNVGLSVSRVGGDAQTKAMKKAAGTIRLELAQYRELDETTKRQLDYGQGLMRLLRQRQHSPQSQHEQVIALTAALHHVMQNIPVSQIEEFRRELVKEMEQREPALCRELDREGILTDERQEAILQRAKEFLARWLSDRNAEGGV
ncbi:MAG: F0F1 ATP synthase subunit alpha [Eubacteriales bacterium]|nr:F0F1 ATP synthase subunit alpha [Eubacteriales bacterium]